MNNEKPTYQDLQKQLEHEKNIKNNLLWYLTFTNQLEGFNTYLSIEGVDSIIDKSKRFQMMMHIDKILEIKDVTKSNILNRNFTICPN